MRRTSVILGTVLAVLLFPVPASAFAHDRVDNLALHAALDVLALVAVSAPLWTALLWGRERRLWLLGLIAVVQAPVAVIGFAPVVDPVLHVVAVFAALALTGFSIMYVRRVAIGSVPGAPVVVATAPARMRRR